jgi:CRISPR-associated endonuclease Csy4
MNFYQEITLLPQAEISPYFIWQKLYQQIHLTLVENKVNEYASVIGASFPEYDVHRYLLGCKLRLFAPEKSALEKLQCEKWLGRLKDYLQYGNIAPVPEVVAGHACFRQVKPKGSKEKLVRRRAKRHRETLEQALAHYDAYKEEHSRLPYINMGSQTNGSHFRLFIEKQEKAQPQPGVFSCYGLSRTTTVPLF